MVAGLKFKLRHIKRTPDVHTIARSDIMRRDIDKFEGARAWGHQPGFYGN